MGEDQWTAVDGYLERLFPPDPLLTGVLESAHAAGLPNIHVSPALGRLLAVLARSVEAKSALEIGTLAGYSTIWLARSLEAPARVVTLEADPAHARRARDNLAAAGLGDTVRVIDGPALASLPEVAEEHPNGFDLVFIDADKEGYPDYWPWALRLAHRGTLIVADNVIRDGRVADPDDPGPQVVGVRRFLDLAASEPRVATAVMQTVGAKGYDGISISVVLA